jgi:hypothetical protein
MLRHSPPQRPHGALPRRSANGSKGLAVALKSRGNDVSCVDVEAGIQVNETLWPEFQQINTTMRAYLDEVTDRIIADVIHDDSSEATEVAESHKLTAGSVDIDE